MRFLIVDGHSVIFAWPELRARHGRSTDAARGELVQRLTTYQDASGVRVVVVFDGKGAKPGDETEPGGIQIFYSKTGQTADDIVKRLVARYAKEHEITVASDDLMERQTALTFGAMTMSTSMLRDTLADADRDLARRLRDHRRR